MKNNKENKSQYNSSEVFGQRLPKNRKKKMQGVKNGG